MFKVALLDISEPVLRHAQGLGRGLEIHAAGFPRFADTVRDGSKTNGPFEIDPVPAGKFSQERPRYFAEPSSHKPDFVLRQNLSHEISCFP